MKTIEELEKKLNTKGDGRLKKAISIKDIAEFLNDAEIIKNQYNTQDCVIILTDSDGNNIKVTFEIEGNLVTHVFF